MQPNHPTILPHAPDHSTSLPHAPDHSTSLTILSHAPDHSTSLTILSHAPDHPTSLTILSHAPDHPTSLTNVHDMHQASHTTKQRKPQTRVLKQAIYSNRQLTGTYIVRKLTDDAILLSSLGLNFLPVPSV